MSAPTTSERELALALGELAGIRAHLVRSIEQVTAFRDESDRDGDLIQAHRWAMHESARAQLVSQLAYFDGRTGDRFVP